MKIYHIIKKSSDDTNFRIVMLDALDRVQTLKKMYKNLNIKVYLASGFFHVDVPYPKIDVFNYVDSCTKLTLLNLLSGLNVEIFGAYNGKKDLLALKSKLSSVSKTLTIYYKYRFHTKLFVISINGTPIFEIIGSSNMTLPAYEGIQYSTGGKCAFSLNTESDLILYNDEFSVEDSKCILGDDIKVQSNVMRFNYDRNDNNNIAFEERMKSVVDYLGILKAQMKEL